MIKYFILFFIICYSSLKAEDLCFDGFLCESKISNSDKIENRRYIVKLLEPIEALLPSRGVEKIYFFELENWNQIHVFNNKYVKITGNFTKISPPIFLGIPVLKVTVLLKK